MPEQEESRECLGLAFEHLKALHATAAESGNYRFVSWISTDKRPMVTDGLPQSAQP